MSFLLLSYVSFSFLSSSLFFAEFLLTIPPLHSPSLLSLLFFSPSSSLLRPMRWLVFVSLSLVAAAGSGLNNEITFTAVRDSASHPLPFTQTHMQARVHTREQAQVCECAHRYNCRVGCLKWEAPIRACTLTHVQPCETHKYKHTHVRKDTLSTHANKYVQQMPPHTLQYVLRHTLTHSHTPGWAERSRIEVNVLITLAATREAHFVLLNRDEESITNREKERTTDTERKDKMSHEQSSLYPLLPAEIFS